MKKKLLLQEDQFLKASYITHDIVADKKSGNDILGSINMIEYNWNYLHEYKHLLNMSN